MHDLDVIVTLGIVLALRDPRRTALTVAVGLAQIGEFSFILAALGMQLGVLPQAGFDALVAAAIVSIAVNPLLFRAQRAWERRLAPAAAAAVPPGAALVVTGEGALGRRVIERCAAEAMPLCVVAKEMEALEEMRTRGIPAVYGDPARAEVLRAAGLAGAKLIVVTGPVLMDKIRVCAAAREVNPRIAIVATGAGPAERAWLQEVGAGFVCDPLDEAGEALLRTIHAGL
jgi:CPA2 family monovalent cation:H+ antiporter-2